MTACGKAESKPIDLGDVNIENAMKDWPKLAKSRFNANKK